MPVFIDIDSPEHHLVASGAGNAKTLLGPPEAGGIVVGLINNMPDSALISTERQVFRLLNAAAGKIPVRLRLFTLPKVPRTDWGCNIPGDFIPTSASCGATVSTRFSSPGLSLRRPNWQKNLIGNRLEKLSIGRQNILRRRFGLV